MINGIGKSGAGRIEPQRLGGGQAAGAAAPVTGAPDQAASSAGSIVAEMVGAGPPVDGFKVAALRQAISEGRYAVDPQRIAERMIEIDLPR